MMHFIPIDNEDEAMATTNDNRRSFFDDGDADANITDTLMDPFLFSFPSKSEQRNSKSLFSLLPNEEFEAFSTNSPFENPFGDPDMEPRPLASSSGACCVGQEHTERIKTLFPEEVEIDPAALANLIGFALSDEGDNSASTEQQQQQQQPAPSLKRDIRMSAAQEPVMPPHKKRKVSISLPPAPISTTTNKKNENNNIDEDTTARFRPHQEALWQEQFQKLLQYMDQYNHCCVPITFGEDQMLARWVKRQRYQYKRYQDGKTSAINAERIELLESVGFVWDAHSALWHQKFNELVVYTKEKGHCHMPSYDPENVQLSTWVKCQRRQYKLLQDGKASNMTQERIEKLNAIGFVWSMRNVKSSDQ